jgi:hypothetical protein
VRSSTDEWCCEKCAEWNTGYAGECWNCSQARLYWLGLGVSDDLSIEGCESGVLAVSKRRNSKRASEVEVSISAVVVPGFCAGCGCNHYGVAFTVCGDGRVVVDDVIGSFASYQDASMALPGMVSEYVAEIEQSQSRSLN